MSERIKYNKCEKKVTIRDPPQANWSFHEQILQVFHAFLDLMKLRRRNEIEMNIIKTKIQFFLGFHVGVIEKSFRLMHHLLL